MGNLFDRIKDTVQKLKPQRLPDFKEEPGVPGEAPPGEAVEPAPPPTEPMEYLAEAGMVSTIRKAAQNRYLLYMLYNNTWRHVEPYSFRGGKQGQLLYGHCLIHNDTHSFYVHKIQDLQLTDIPFSPRWMVEI